MVRLLGLVVLLLSPSPILCLFLTESVLESGTVSALQSRLDRGTITLANGGPTTSSQAVAREFWREAHEVNFALGFAFLVACGSSVALATAGGLLVARGGRGTRGNHAAASVT